MFSIFKKREKQKQIVVIQLNARLQPMHRADIEDAFDEGMLAYPHSAHVVGGGTLLKENGEISCCDIEIEVDDLSEQTINHIIGLFEAMLAPKGSVLSLPGEGGKLSFGKHEGLALYLNGTELPDEVYQTCDSNHVYAECDRHLGETGRIHSHWDGPQETALYMYGEDFQTMHDRLMPFLQSYPLCQKCRVEKIA